MKAIRQHTRKNRIDDPFSELLKDADAWQLAQTEGNFGRNPYRHVRALLADAQINIHTTASDTDMKWPHLKQPECLAEAMEGECRQLSLALAPFLDDEIIPSCISRHIVHALRQQTRKTASLMTYLAPLMPAVPCSNMLAALRAVLSAVGPVRDADVLLAWLQKSFPPEDMVNTQGAPDLKETVFGTQADLLRRLRRMRVNRLVKAVDQVRKHRTNLAAFSDAEAFSCLSLLSSQDLAAFHAEQFATFRRSLSKAAASLIRKVEKREKSDQALHKFRLQAKSAHHVLMTMHDASDGTDPCYPFLMDTLVKIRVLLGEWQDAVAGTALLQKALDGLSMGKKPSEDHSSPIPGKWKKHVVRTTHRMNRNVHSLLFILQKLI